MRWRLLVTVYGLILVGELMWSAMVPLVPVFARSLDLSTLETGVLVAGTGAAVLVVSIPAGVLADRVGARRVAVVASLFLSVGLAGHALPNSFWSLLVSRVVFGVGFGGLWTAGIALAGDLAPPRLRARALALPMTIAGVGFAAGPALVGLLVGRFGTRPPFAVAAAVVLGFAICLALGRGPAATGGQARETVTLGRLRRATKVQVGLASMLVAGVTGSTIFLLVPLQLAREGIGPAGVGIVFSIAAVAFVVASAAVTRAGARAVTVGVAAVATVALVVPMTLPLLAGGAIPVIALVVLRGPAAAVLFGVSYPICAEGADEAGLGRGSVLGLLNMAWAASAVLGPIGGGAIAQFGGDRAVYLVLIAACLVAAPWMRGRRRLAPLPDPA